jgi:hypothetical protein
VAREDECPYIDVPFLSIGASNPASSSTDKILIAARLAIDELSDGLTIIDILAA